MFNNMYYPQFQNQSLIRVNGIDGAKAYQLSANSQVALFDANDDLMYIKIIDGAGFPTIRTFKFEEVDTSIKKVDTSTNFITREEMEEYVKQFIQSTNTTDTDTTNKSTADTDDKSNVWKTRNDTRTDG